MMKRKIPTCLNFSFKPNITGYTSEIVTYDSPSNRFTASANGLKISRISDRISHSCGPNSWMILKSRQTSQICLKKIRFAYKITRLRFELHLPFDLQNPIKNVKPINPSSCNRLYQTNTTWGTFPQLLHCFLTSRYFRDQSMAFCFRFFNLGWIIHSLKEKAAVFSAFFSRENKKSFYLAHCEHQIVCKAANPFVPIKIWIHI